MRRMGLALATVVMLSAPLAAQNVRQQGTTVAVRKYTDLERWDRTAFHFHSFFIAGIAQAKSLGKTAEDYGRFVGDLFASSWGPPNSGVPVDIARAWIVNMGAFPNTDAQILSVTDSSATLRYRRTYAGFFANGQAVFGVTLAEYDHAFDALVGRIADYLGVRIDSRVDGEWNVRTLRGRGRNAPSAEFPRGTYIAAFSLETTRTHPELAGRWEVTYGPDGRYILRKNGAPFVAGSYRIMLDQLLITGRETGSKGTPGCPGAATYTWSVDPNTKQLHFELIDDRCAARILWTSEAVLTKK